jgi:hypothetical protein
MIRCAGERLVVEESDMDKIREYEFWNALVRDSGFFLRLYIKNSFY